MNQAPKEWEAISLYYGERKAQRSGLPHIRHIVQGLVVLDEIGASERSKRAFCIHPLCQIDLDLVNFNPTPYESSIIMLAMEYRHIANGHLETKPTDSKTKIKISPLSSVNLMLIADKVQNKKDFEANQAKYENRFELMLYFEKWLTALGLSPARYKILCDAIDRKTDTYHQTLKDTGWTAPKMQEKN